MRIQGSGAPAGAPTHLEHADAMHGWVQGDAVRVRGMRGDFRFRYGTRNTRTGDEWATVYGDGRFRSVAFDRLTRRKVKP